jgi:hypothetical protein
VTTPHADQKGLGWKFATAFTAAMLILRAPSKGAADSTLAPLEVVKLDGKVCVSTRLLGGFTKTVTDTITSGIPATFSYEIELWSKKPLWADESIVSKALGRLVTFNSLTNEFQVAQEGSAAKWGRTSKDLEEVKKWVTPVEVLPLVSVEDLDPKQKYYVRVRAMVKTDQSRSALKSVLLFISSFKVRTGWKQSELFALEDLVSSNVSGPSTPPSERNP